VGDDVANVRDMGWQIELPDRPELAQRARRFAESIASLQEKRRAPWTYNLHHPPERRDHLQSIVGACQETMLTWNAGQAP